MLKINRNCRGLGHNGRRCLISEMGAIPLCCQVWVALGKPLGGAALRHLKAGNQTKAPDRPAKSGACLPPGTAVVRASAYHGRRWKPPRRRVETLGESPGVCACLGLLVFALFCGFCSFSRGMRFLFFVLLSTGSLLSIGFGLVWLIN